MSDKKRPSKKSEAITSFIVMDVLEKAKKAEAEGPRH